MLLQWYDIVSKVVSINTCLWTIFLGPCSCKYYDVDWRLLKTVIHCFIQIFIEFTTLFYLLKVKTKIIHFFSVLYWSTSQKKIKMATERLVCCRQSNTLNLFVHCVVTGGQMFVVDNALSSWIYDMRTCEIVYITYDIRIVLYMYTYCIYTYSPALFI